MTLDTLVRTPTPNQADNAPRKDVCLICTKVVYPMDKVAADDKIFHKTCLRCGHCKKVLSLGNYAALNNVFYCKPHFKQLFALKGNYSDGFKASEAAAGVTDEKSSPTTSPSAIRAKSSPSPAPASGTESSSETQNAYSGSAKQTTSQPRDDIPVSASLAERMNALKMHGDNNEKKEAPISESEAPRGTVADRMGMFSKSVDNVSSTPERSATPVAPASASASAPAPAAKQNENKNDEVERLTAELTEMREKYAAAQEEIASLKSKLAEREQEMAS